MDISKGVVVILTFYITIRIRISSNITVNLDKGNCVLLYNTTKKKTFLIFNNWYI